MSELSSVQLSVLEQKAMLMIMRQHPKAYGVSIQAKLEEETGKPHSIGSIYACLDRLEEKGFVKTQVGEPTSERGGKAKLYYALTGLGQAALHDAMNTWGILSKGISWQGALA